jgi:putative intracellular protease/amidase
MRLSGKKMVVLVAEGFEDLEYWVTVMRLREEGAEVISVGPSPTGSLGIKDDLENAGATWVDKPAFREGNLVWGRVVPDIPAFCRELVAALAEQ